MLERRQAIFGVLATPFIIQNPSSLMKLKSKTISQYYREKKLLDLVEFINKSTQDIIDYLRNTPPGEVSITHDIFQIQIDNADKIIVECKDIGFYLDKA